MRALFRTAVVLVVLLGLGLGAGLALHWPAAAPALPARPAAGEAQAPADASGAFATQLTRLEAAVDAQRRADQRQSGAFAENLRTAAMRLSMSGPLAPLTQRTLIALGERPALQKTLFWLMPLVGWMSEPFLYPLPAGADPAARLQALIDARAAAGIRVTLDNVGDASHSAAKAAAYRDFYRRLILAADGGGMPPPLSVSLKLSALVDDLPAALGAAGTTKRAEILDALRALLGPSADGAPAAVFIRVDMEEYAYKDLTLALFRELIETAPELAMDATGQSRIGVVIQAYLRDSARDLASLATWGEARGVRIPVRLVKGAYADDEKTLARNQHRPSPVWDFKASTDASYLMLADYLLRHPERFDTRFATHNMSTQARVMALAAARGYRPEQIEFQMLYGMGEPIKQALVTLGYPVREYVPAGSLARGLGYAGRRFAELTNPDNALARTLQGDYSALAETPEFVSEQDRADAEAARAALMATGPKGARTGTTYALLIGVCVPWASPPAAVCEQNVALMAATLTETLELDEQHLRTLVGSAARYQGVVDAFAWLRASVTPADRVMFYYNGHGVLSGDDNGDEADGLDEILCLWSARPPFSRQAALWTQTWMSDDRLAALLRALPTRQQILIMDTCHGEAAIHGFDRGGAPTHYDQGQAALLAAARADQLALTDVSGRYGLFTQTLATALKERPATLRAAFDQAAAATWAESRRLCQARAADSAGQPPCVEQRPTLTDPLRLTEMPW